MTSTKEINLITNNNILSNTNDDNEDIVNVKNDKKKAMKGSSTAI